MRYELVMANGIYLAAWEDPSFPVSYAFPDQLWESGVMLLNNTPVIVTKWVEFREDGRRQWRKTVPRGASKKRETIAVNAPRTRCCRD